MIIPFETLFTPERRADLDREGYAVAPLQIGTVTLHVVAVRVVLNDDDFIEYASTLSGSDEDADHILSLKGDTGGPPQLHEYNGHTYLLGAAPYGR